MLFFHFCLPLFFQGFEGLRFLQNFVLHFFLSPPHLGALLLNHLLLTLAPLLHLAKLVEILLLEVGLPLSLSVEVLVGLLPIVLEVDWR